MYLSEIGLILPVDCAHELLVVLKVGTQPGGDSCEIS